MARLRRYAGAAARDLFAASIGFWIAIVIEYRYRHEQNPTHERHS